MASSSTEPTAPSATQLLFARSVIYTFDLWPALRLAISEQWGGIESKDKADFLISYLCDEYTEEKSSPASNNGNPGTSAAIVAPQTPDADDLAEILEGYFADEFESRLEDESADMIAARLVQFHRLIYATFPPTQQSLEAASAEVKKLEEHAVAIRGKKVVAERTEATDESGSEDEEDGSNSKEDDAMEVDSTPKAKAESIVDEDGFTTVVKGKRR